MLSDHDSVHLSLDLHDVYTRGPGIWRLNLHLLKDELFCSEISELTSSLKDMAHKSPGPDGLSLEFYLTFWARLGPILVRVFNLCYSRGDLSLSMKESATRLILKLISKINFRNFKNL